jgi:hypothetical protein
VHEEESGKLVRRRQPGQQLICTNSPKYLELTPAHNNSQSPNPSFHSTQNRSQEVTKQGIVLNRSSSRRIRRYQTTKSEITVQTAEYITLQLPIIQLCLSTGPNIRCLYKLFNKDYLISILTCTDLYRPLERNYFLYLSTQPTTL